jgi:NAD(P)-dependent dehydrogenase (short-subunit alcohol dehydrogenase family)
MFDFTGKVVIIGGASGSLGSALVRAFGAAGASLVLPDRKTGRIAEMFPEIAGSGDHLLLDALNVTQPEGAEKLVEETLARFGQVDVLANTIGGYDAGKPPHETPLETWDGMMNVNARSAFVLSRAAIPPMLERKRGAIIHTGSKSSLGAGSRDVAYSASKSAVARLVESLSAAYRRSGLRINGVLPGTMDTEDNRAAMPNADHSRWVSTDDVASVFLFLASDAARAVTGALVPAYGKS